MKMPSALSSVPERAWLFVFGGIFILGGIGTFFLYTDTRLLEQKIISKQKEVASVLQLKETYEATNRGPEKSIQKTGSAGMSLASVELIVSKTLVGGKLTMLKPATLKEERGAQQVVIELRVAGAPLGEVVSFLNAAQAAGFRVKQLQLTVPQANPTGIDMHVIMAQV
jgi:hypothetical protein